VGDENTPAAPGLLMPHITPFEYGIAILVGGAVVIFWRIRETRSAVTLKKILIPPAGMATGFSMFAVPAFHIPLTWALIAFATGATLFAWPLLATTKLYRQGAVIMMKRSPAFLVVIVLLFAVRFLADGYFDRFLTVPQTAGTFFTLAFGMILAWRGSIFLSYRKLTAQPAPSMEAASATPALDAEEV
jgi:membrane protein CcdC involved in cytochrome C biogenesis